MNLENIQIPALKPLEEDERMISESPTIKNILSLIKEKKRSLKFSINQSRTVILQKDNLKETLFNDDRDNNQERQTPLKSDEIFSKQRLTKTRAKTIDVQQIRRKEESESQSEGQIFPQKLESRNKFLIKIRNNKRNLSSLPELIVNKKSQIFKLTPLPKKTNVNLLKILIEITESTEISNEQFHSLKVELLKNQNSFFCKMNQILINCLLKVNKIIQVRENQVLFKKREKKQCFYIILFGKVLIVRQNALSRHKKIYGQGQSIGQQIIFSKKAVKNMKESVKTLSDCYLLEIKMDNYNEMMEQLKKFGQSQAVVLLKAELHKNFLIKDWDRKEISQIK